MIKSQGATFAGFAMVSIKLTIELLVSNYDAISRIWVFAC